MNINYKYTTFALAALLLACIAFSLGTCMGWHDKGGGRGDHAMQGMMDHDMDSMDMSMKGMTDNLAGKTGISFDKAFLSEMTIHHEGAVAMAQQVLTTSNRPELKAFAQKIIVAQAAEITQMKSWEAAWFPAAPAQQ
jgi:uncharacterized protein (DUF305 family)